MPVRVPKKYQGFQKYYFRQAKVLYEKPAVKASLTLILSLLTVAFLSFFAIRPTLSTITNLLKEIEDKTQADKKLGEKINVLTVVQGKYNQIEKDLAFISEALPEQGEYGKFIQKIEYLAYLHNLEIVSSSFPEYTLVGKPEEGKESPMENKATQKREKEESAKGKEEKIIKAEELVFTIEVEGEYKDTKAFLNDLENFDRLVIIDSFSLLKKEREETLINSKVTGKTFFLGVTTSKEKKEGK